MITLQEYFGPWATSPDATPERQANAERLLAICENLEAEMTADGVTFPDNPATGNGVSGEKFGGFRPQDCPEGAPHSSHKEGLAVDRYDPDNDIDEWCLRHQDRLQHWGVYIEAPQSTPRWSHWTIRPPASGHTVFIP